MIEFELQFLTFVFVVVVVVVVVISLEFTYKRYKERLEIAISFRIGYVIYSIWTMLLVFFSSKKIHIFHSSCEYKCASVCICVHSIYQIPYCTFRWSRFRSLSLSLSIHSEPILLRWKVCAVCVYFTGTNHLKMDEIHFDKTFCIRLTKAFPKLSTIKS